VSVAPGGDGGVGRSPRRQRIDRDQFIELVRERAGVAVSRQMDAMPLTDAEMTDRALVDFDAARAGVRAVFRTLREAVTGDELEDVLAQLPREYTALLDESD
jgi:uncharacterized protein (DUF2267 family)